MTNVHKHAAGAKTYVRLAHRVSEIAMQVENELGRGGGVVGAVAVRGERAGGDEGAGLRVGWGVRVGADGGGGFRVSAVIPAS